MQESCWGFKANTRRKLAGDTSLLIYIRPDLSVHTPSLCSNTYLHTLGEFILPVMLCPNVPAFILLIPQTHTITVPNAKGGRELYRTDYVSLNDDECSLISTNLYNYPFSSLLLMLDVFDCVVWELAVVPASCCKGPLDTAVQENLPPPNLPSLAPPLPHSIRVTIVTGYTCSQSRTGWIHTHSLKHYNNHGFDCLCWLTGHEL